MDTAVRRRRLPGGALLIGAFAFSVMGDPVSSVAYAIEAALVALDGDLGLLAPTMAVVLGIIVLVAINYHQLYARFPEGGGDAAAAGTVFGEGWSFMPLGSLIVDYTLTIAISVAAGASALISWFPELAGARVPLALGLMALVAALSWFGHRGREVFALMTIAFVTVASVVIWVGLVAPVQPSAPMAPALSNDGWPPLTILLAFPVAMALATGIEAPSSAIAQLGQLDDDGRRGAARLTLWMMITIVIWLTGGMTAVAVTLDVGLPPPDSTMVAEIARRAVGEGFMFGAFQATTAVLLLAAASSSFQAGPGLLKALARATPGVEVLPERFGLVNRFFTPVWGIGTFAVVSGLAVAAAGGLEQRLVLFYAVAVFVAFLFGLLAMARIFQREGRRWLLVVNVLGTIGVAITLIVDLTRGDPIASLALSGLAAGVLYLMWVRSGRPEGVAHSHRVAHEHKPRD